MTILTLLLYFIFLAIFAFVVRWLVNKVKKLQESIEKIPVTVVIEITDKGYSCYVEQDQFKGIIAIEETVPELKKSITYAIIDHIDFMNEATDTSLGYCDFEINYINQTT